MLATLGALCGLGGCAPSGERTDGESPGTQVAVGQQAPAIDANPNRSAWFGDLHVHSLHSLDAFIFGTRATPDDAYRYARGEPLAHPAGFEMQLSAPLDFQAVTDHASYLGIMAAMADPASNVGAHPLAMALRDAKNPDERLSYFLDVVPAMLGSDEGAELLDLDIVRDAWRDIVETAERHNEPGVFTTFIGYEYTASGPEGANLHRNVIFRGSNAPDLPFGAVDSLNPEDLWDWMDGLRALGIESLAIPHNPNRSNGMMFEPNDRAGRPIDAIYANQRMRNEPLVEVTQVKGTSDTHPLLSPNDEWADFGISDQRARSPLPSRAAGSYVRNAWLRGLAIENDRGSNPFRFGLIGSSDTHNAGGSFREENYVGKLGLLDATPQQRGSVLPADPARAVRDPAPTDGRTWGASGLAGAWAESNTRDAIFAAFRRKETFATSGPRIRVRFFAGTGIDESLLDADDPIAAAYESGVPMGADLPPGDGSAPGFFVWAMRDPETVPLQRLQVVKGWIEGDETREQVYDVACSDGGQLDIDTHRCSDNGATVDLSTCNVSRETGAAELAAVWNDPGFRPGQRAFYYVRVLENPKCRWSTWDAIRAGVAPNPDMHATIQDRAWSSPIWTGPAR